MKRMVWLNLCWLLALAAAATGMAAPSAKLSLDDLWWNEIQPLLDNHCFRCHGGVRQKAGLDLRSLENILTGGEHGPALQPGHPEESLLYQYIQPGADPHMPQGEGKQLAPKEIMAVKRWITAMPAAERPASPGRSPWVSDYLAALKKSRRPVFVPPAGMSASEAIDRFLALGWKEKRVEPPSLCDGRTFLRRAYLDLVGRIPTIDEMNQALAGGARATRSSSNPRSKWRAALVDELLGREEHARHLREIFDVVLLERRDVEREQRRRDNQWYRFLEDSFRTNRPWNEVVGDLIRARPAGEKSRGAGAAWYLYERRDNHQAMAEAIGPVAYGMQVKCAQCHNHPLAAEIEQRHYWGLVAAFNRSKNIETAAGPAVAESATGGFIKFANLKNESQPALLAFPDGKSVPEQRPGDNESVSDSADLYLVAPSTGQEKPAQAAVPKFSRRDALAEAVTANNPLLARAFVNRIWALLMGRGLVHPVDQMDSQHRPSHPDLLDWLAQDFERSGYDVRRLIRAIVLSRGYQLDSRPRKGTMPGPETFAHALDKPLSAEQLYRSFLVATGEKPSSPGGQAVKAQTELRRALVTRVPELFPADYNASLPQALFLSYSPLLEEFLKSHPGNTTARLSALASPEARVEQAFITVLGRSPAVDEKAEAQSFLARRSAEGGVRHLLWALLSSAEFQVNH